jgi:SIR2-like domain
VITDQDWTSLLTSIFEYNECTPFLGAGACTPFFPSSQQLAEKWAAEVSYPFYHKDLAEVAQFIAINWGGKMAKFRMDKALKDCLQTNPPPDFKSQLAIHGILADLPLKIYLTTNYDNLIERALSANNKAPVGDYCRWNRSLQLLHPPAESPAPTIEKPLVYHIHGLMGVPETMVLTDDDYETFLLEFGLDDNLVPPSVRIAISQYPLLFVGYSLRDWNFRVLFKAVIKEFERNAGIPGITVQLSPSEVTDQAAATAYITKKYEQIGLKIFWGTAAEFATTFREKMGKYLQECPVKQREISEASSAGGPA